MHKREFEKIFRDSHKFLQAHEKCVMKMKVAGRNMQRKNNAHIKMFTDGRKHFIGRIQKTGENDLDKLQVNNYGHNDGTI